ncbi:hypothetical protein KLEB273_gp242 [Bacillus phage vB_BauM_KLEB27-3]|nr:hypothetical protein KLEB273_gp242 [Bacillus phage vB_BauM_KLEB27-3]
MKIEKDIQSKGINYRVVITYYDSSSSDIQSASLYDNFGNNLMRVSSFHALGTKWQHLFDDPIALTKELVASHERNINKNHQESQQLNDFHQWNGQL